ncbi:MAG: hypothetical protein WD795_16985 [Woeseia sp.]
MPNADNDDWRQATPLGTLRFAEEYCQVAEGGLERHRSRLPENQRHHTLVPFPIYFNYLHSIELALKAYMLHTGSGLQELRPPGGVGHNLNASLGACIERSLRDHCPELSDMLIEVITESDEMYKKKDFEYIRQGDVTLQHIDQIALAANALLSGLRTLQMLPVRPDQQPVL